MAESQENFTNSSINSYKRNNQQPNHVPPLQNITEETIKNLSLALTLLLCLQSSQTQRTYDTSDWIPLPGPCPGCQEKQEQHNLEKKATGRVLNIGSRDHPNSFVDSEKFGNYNNQQYYRQQQTLAASQQSFNYQNAPATFQERQQPNLRNSNGFTEGDKENNKRQHLLAQKALEPLFLNQELQPPKKYSVDSQEEANNQQFVGSEELADQTFKQSLNPQRFQSADLVDTSPPVRFNLLQSNNKPIQHGIQTSQIIDINQNNFKSQPLQQQSFSLENQSPQINGNPSFERNQASHGNQFSQEQSNLGNSKNINFQTVQIIDTGLSPNRNNNGFQTFGPAPSNSFRQNEITINQDFLQNSRQNAFPQEGNTFFSTSQIIDVNPDVTKTATINQANGNGDGHSKLPSLSLSQTITNQQQEKQLPNIDFSSGSHSGVLFRDNSALSFQQPPVSDFQKYEDNNKKAVEITTLKTPQENETVELLYVPLNSLNKHQEPQTTLNDKQFRVPDPQQVFSNNSFERTTSHGKNVAAEQQNHHLENIQNDFAKQALEAFKLQRQLQTGDLPPSAPQTESLSVPLRQTKRKKPHQPPLAVYMESHGEVKVSDVLTLLKGSESISVQDTVGPDSPQIFVGPYDLDPPEGYVKFELPYLSSLDNNRIERKVDSLPFFVAPINYKAPEGYSKIPLPSPHVGSIVVSSKATDKPTPAPLLENISPASIPPSLSQGKHEFSEHKQHYRDTLDQPEGYSDLQGFLPSNVPVRQTPDQYDFTQFNNGFVQSNPRIQSPQSKFEEEYNRINSIYQTSPKPEISKFVITTSTLSPFNEQGFYSPTTGITESIPQKQQPLSSQPWTPPNNDRTPDQYKNAPPQQQLTPVTSEYLAREAIPVITKIEENSQVQGVVSERPRGRPVQQHLTEETEPVTTKRPLRGRTRVNVHSEQSSTKVSRERGSTQYNPTSYGSEDNRDNEKHSLPGDISSQRARGNPSRSRHTTRTRGRLTQPSAAGVTELEPTTPRSKELESTVGYSTLKEFPHTHISEPNQSIRTEGSVPQTPLTSPSAPYYSDLSDIRPFQQQVPDSAHLQDREEANKQRSQTVSSLEHNLGIPISSNGATGILQQKAGISDGSYSDDGAFKSTEEPVFEFTSRTQPPRSRPPKFDSFEMDSPSSSSTSHESSEFDDFYLTSSAAEEDTKPFKVPSKIPPVNPVLPGLINNLQDQSIRSILNPALIAPTTESVDEILPSIRTQAPSEHIPQQPVSQRQNLYQPRPQHQETYEAPVQPQTSVTFRPQQPTPIQQMREKQVLDAENVQSHYLTRPSVRNEQYETTLNHPTGSFMFTQKGLPSKIAEPVESSTHLPTVESTTTRGRGRGRHRAHTSLAQSTIAPRRNIQRGRRPSSRGDVQRGNVGYQVTSSTHSPVRTTAREIKYQAPNDFDVTERPQKSITRQRFRTKSRPLAVENLGIDGATVTGPAQEIPQNVYIKDMHPGSPQGVYLSNDPNAYTMYERNIPILTHPDNLPYSGNTAQQQAHYIHEDGLQAAQDLKSVYSEPITKAATEESKTILTATLKEPNPSSTDRQIIEPIAGSSPSAEHNNMHYNSNAYLTELPTNGNKDSVNTDEFNELSNSSQYDTTTLQVANELTEEITTKKSERPRARGRLNGRQRFTPSTTTSKPISSSTSNSEKAQEEEFYGFYRTPNFNTIAPTLTTPAVTSKSKTHYTLHRKFPSAPDSQEVSISTSENESAVQQHSEDARPKYFSVIRNSEQRLEGLSESSATKEPELTTTNRKRGKTRKQYSRTSTFKPHTTEATGRKFSPSEGPTTQGAQKTRSRGRTYFQLPGSVKEKREDDLEPANYPESFLSGQGIKARQVSPTESSAFQITVGNPFNDADLSEYDQMTNPSYYRPKIVMPDGSSPIFPKNYIETDRKREQNSNKKLANNIDNHKLEKSQTSEGSSKVESEQTSEKESEKQINATDISHKRKRGYWRLVKRPLHDPLETSESQNVETIIMNGIHKGENKNTFFNKNMKYNSKTTSSETTHMNSLGSVPSHIPTKSSGSSIKTDGTQENIFDSIYEIFGISEGDIQDADNPQNYDIKETIKANNSKPIENTVTATPSSTKVTKPLISAKLNTSESLEDDFNENLDDESNRQPTVISSTGSPIKTTNSFERSMRTLKSTEISHETEICYRGRCIRSSKPSL